MQNTHSIEELLKMVSELKDTVNKLNSKIELLESENRALKEELSKQKIKKNSNNSSIPPSKDENRKRRNNSLREKTGKKIGGQKGHDGNTLKMNNNPDQIIRHIPNFCNCCGTNLESNTFTLIGQRQVIDIPPIRPITIEHQIFETTCRCGQKISGKFPDTVQAPVGYGEKIESLIAYLHSRQFVPFQRMQELLNDLFGISISQGGIDHLLNRFTQKAKFVYDQIHQQITQSCVVGTDETGGKVNGKNHWFWTWQTPHLTFITISDNRGIDTINENFENKLNNSILIHDCWKPHFNANAQNHQICLAHLLREINYLNQLYQNNWSVDFQKLLQDAITLKKSMNHDDYQNKNFDGRKQIMNRFEKLLLEEIPKNHSKLETFFKRILKYKDYLFVFLYYTDVPPDNNASERAIRNIKVKLKVSGQFKSFNGAQRFSIIRSVTDTVIKNGQNILTALNIIAKFGFSYTE